MLLKILPAFVKQPFINVNNLNRTTVQQSVANLYRLGISATAVEEGDDLANDIYCRNHQRKVFQKLIL